MWWDNGTIDRTVTREFVCSHLIPREIERLDRPLGFGDGLTDGTYWEWIDEKAKKIFLILADLGVPDQIFGVIDDSWDDQDLPIALDQVQRLALTSSKDEKFERRFYLRQFHYLLRPLQQGDCIAYQDEEVVPLDVVDKKRAAGQSRHVDKVMLPNEPGMVFSRHRVPVGPGHLSQEDFLLENNRIENLQNEHLRSYWASYIHQGYGYILLTPAADFTLKTLLTTMPRCVKDLDKKARRQTVMNWIHCLVDAVCFIHNRGLSHGNIRPSTVLFSSDNLIFLTEPTRFHTELLGAMTDTNSFDKEAYDYAAPEQWFKPTSSIPSPVNRSTDQGQSAPVNLHAPTPHLDPQAADIFSLGCIILELLSFLFKKHGRPFAAHRAAKRRSPGRGGAVPDSSFRRNLGQVESWMAQLARDASKKKDDDPSFAGVAPMLHVVKHMLAFHPSDRPAADDVQAKLYQILTESCGIAEPHCVHRDGGWDCGIGSSLNLSSSTLVPAGSHDTRSTATKRSCGSRDGDSRFDSGGGSNAGVRGPSSSAPQGQSEAAKPRHGSDLSEGLQAVERIVGGGGKGRKWQLGPFPAISAGKVICICFPLLPVGR
ncbi:hypothetical protein VTK56DRAFT_4542 [Thermocarpiscus australiensis]